MARQTKDAATRAQEALDVAERRVKKLTEALEKSNREREKLAADIGAAMARRDYLAQNPDLPEPKPFENPNKPGKPHETDPEF